MTSRRHFIQFCALAGSTALPAAARAQAPLVDEQSTQAQALGYVGNAARVDRAKYKQYAAGQHCGGCALYQGGSAANGKCALFPGKEVAATGWCSAYAKRT